ncbi:MAG: phage virion morphogenesis protein [Rhodocyclaceae bacterium]|nr:phage virion morphogenesis protein [Rhodocyclaceae bacterium]
MITIQYDDREVQAALARLSERARNLAPVMRAIGAHLRSDIVERFATSTSPEGQPWRDLTGAAIISRARRHAPKGFKKRRAATLARFGKGAKPLVDTGALRNSIQILRVSNDEVTVGTRLPYAAIHHFGGRAGRGRKVTIPGAPLHGRVRNGQSGNPRPHPPLHGARMIDRIEEAIVQRLTDAVGMRAIAATVLDDVEKIKAPALIVVFDGLTAKDTASARNAVVAESAWMVIILARNATRIQTGQSARQDALATLPRIFSALSGWQPDGAFRPLRFVQADGLEFEPPVATLAMHFTCEIHLTKE